MSNYSFYSFYICVISELCMFRLNAFDIMQHRVMLYNIIRCVTICACYHSQALGGSISSTLFTPARPAIY